MHRYNMRLVLPFLLVSYLASATNYYVSSSTGNDASDGKSVAGAWKTLSKINSGTFSPGDSVLLRKGDIWRETLTIPSSGSSGAYIIFASFGTGAKPKILGSAQAATWSSQGNNIWKSATSVTDPYSGSWPGELFFVGTDGKGSWGHVKKSNTGSLTSEYDWTWVSNYIYVYAATDPGTRYSSVEAPQREYCISLNDKQYITIDGLEFQFAKYSGVDFEGSYPNKALTDLIIRNCNASFVGTKGGAGFGIDVVYSNMLIQNNTIHDCGRRSISLYNYGAITCQNIIVENNTLYNGYHTTGIDVSVGNGAAGTYNNITLRNNLIYDDPNKSVTAPEGYTSELIFLQNYSGSGSTFKNIYIYNNIFMYPSMAAIHMENINSPFIYNNTFYGHSSVVTGNTFHIYIDAGTVNVTLKNNIFYSDLNYATLGSGLCLYTVGKAADVIADYNLYYRIADNLKIIQVGTTEYFRTTSSWASLKSATGWETHSPSPANPLFVSSTDFHLQGTSPAVGAGVAISGITTDIEGKTYTNPPNLGCYATTSAPANLLYVSSSIENSNPSVLQINYNQLLANTVPANSAFNVIVNSSSRSVSSVSVSGSKVLLTLATPVISIDVITVAYTKPAANPIQTPSGQQAPSFSATAVTNNVSPVPVYVSSIIQAATPTLLEMTYTLALANIVPATSAFTVTVNSVARSVVSVSVSGTKVLLTLSSAIIYADIVRVSYIKPSTNPLQTPAGGQAETLTPQTVTTSFVPPVPVYVSSSVQNATPSIVEMTYSLVLANIVPASSAFIVMVNSIPRNVTSVTISGFKVLLTLASPVIYADIITVSYTKPSTNPIQASSGGQAESVSAQAVTNNVYIVPVYYSSIVQDATPSVLEMTYNTTLASIYPAVSAFTVIVNSVSRSVSSVTISGTRVLLTLSSPVVFGDIISISYSRPSTNPLQTPLAVQAESISSQPVVNNVREIPVYLSSVVQNVSPSVLEMTYTLILANIVPSTSAFTVRVNSATRSIVSVAISGNRVLLTLSSPVSYGNNITVSYTKPSSNPLQTQAGGIAASIGAQPVTNNVSSIVPVYVSSVIENASASLLVMTYSLNLASVIPANSAFTVRVNGSRRTVISVAISGNNVTLTLSAPVIYGDGVTVAYTKPSSNPLHSTSGGQAATMSAQPVTNNVASAVPVYLSSVVQNSSPSVLVMTYSLNLAAIVPAGSAFTVTVNSTRRTVSSVVISAANVSLSLSSPVVYGDVVTVAYTKPSNNPLQSTSGGQAVTITAQPVANNVASVIPVYKSSVIENAAPSILVMTYSINLTAVVPDASAFTVIVNNLSRSINSVSISGANVSLTLSSPVVYGDVVTVAYTQPSSNPIQSASGGQAATITAQPVTNNLASSIPVFVVAFFQNNINPNIIVMTYSLNLASIVPAASAFTVMVNSINRPVSSVSISGVNVTLILSSPVVYGDVVTVAYTKPSSNPLQSFAGGQAASISAQPVLNTIPSSIPVYKSSVVENADPSVLVMTYDLNLASIKPANSAFTVTVNSTRRTVISIAISGTNVSLTLSSPVVYGDVITVAYTKPSTNPLQSISGGQAATITAQPVTNNVASVIPVYISSVVEDASPGILVMTYSRNLASTIPANSAFTVTVNSVRRTVTSVSISSTNVSLTLSSPVVYGNVVTVAYTAPSRNPLQSVQGGKAATITAQPVTNNVGSVVPEYLGASVEDADPLVLVMIYSMELAAIVPSSSAFTVKVNSASRVVNSVSISGTYVSLMLSLPVAYGDVINVSYTQPSNNPLQSPSGALAASVIFQPVANNLNAVIPYYVSSVINNSFPSVIAVSYNTTLAYISPDPSAFTVLVNSVQRSVSSVSITGFRVLLTMASPAVNGDVVTVAYTKPAVNQIQTPSGGQADSMTAQLVVNNVDPVIPGYVSSVVENDSPTVLTMTYNLILANIIPDVSAFTVKVNSVSTDVVSVAINNKKVILTLGGAVLFGDAVTVSYTKPPSNPLQNPYGAEAASMSAQNVKNNVGVPNYTPVIEINYDETVYSGFISQLDASGSYDLNNDNLSYQWIVPGQVPFSSTDDPTIRFLAPVVSEPETVKFTVNVDDGEATETKTISIQILPYHPELGTAKIKNLQADDYLGFDYPTNVADGNTETSWSTNGEGHWIVSGLFDPCYISYIMIIYPSDPVRSFNFDIYGSTDEITWYPVLVNAASCSFSSNAQVFEFPASSKNTAYSYVKLVCHGNSVDEMNYVSEFSIFGTSQHAPDNDEVSMTIFPNPANDYVRLLLSDTPLLPLELRILNFTGTLMLEQTIQSIDNYISLPLSLRSGYYLIQLTSGNKIVAVGKLIINEIRSH